MNGWLNVDANIVTAKIDLWANLVDPLPFKHNSMGGYARIAVPHVGNAAKAYVENRTDWRAGLRDIVESAPLKTEYPHIFGEAILMEHESYPSLPHNVVVEVRKT